MLILHNREDRQSREFVERFGAGHTVLDWYDPADQSRWLEAGGILEIQGFPAVIVDMPAVTYDEPSGAGAVEVTEPERQIALGIVRDMVDVGERVAKLNEKIRKHKGPRPDLININRQKITLPERPNKQ